MTDSRTVSPDEPTTARRTKRSTLIAAFAVPALVASGVGVAHAHKNVEIDVDGKVQTLSTFAGSVDGALTKGGVTFGEHDVVSPDPTAALREGDTIVVRTAEPIDVVLDGKVSEVWTTSDNVSDALEQLAASGRSATIVAASRSEERQELTMPLVSDGPIAINDAGKESTIDISGTMTLQEVLKEAGLTLGDEDEVRISTTADGNALVTIDRVATEEREETEKLAFKTVTKKTDDLYEGQSKVTTAGKAGSIVRTFKTVMVNGKEESSEKIDETRTDPVTKVIAVGTKARPAPKAAAPASSSTAATKAPAAKSTAKKQAAKKQAMSSSAKKAESTEKKATGSAPTSGVWASLAQCESGGNPSIVSSNGLYHGLYQFSVGTWKAVGGSGIPSQASAAEQTKRAKILQQRSGWGQWPACSKKLGLR